MFEGNRKRYVILEREFYFEENITPFKNYNVSEFIPMDLDSELMFAVKIWLSEWQRRGEKWNWDDTWTPTIVKIPNEEELCRIIKNLLTDTADHKKKLWIGKEDVAVLMRHFSEEEIQKLLPDRMTPSPPRPTGKRNAYVGLIPSKYTRIPLIFDLDKLCPKHMAFIGASGNGKTIAAYDVAEEAILSNIPVLVLDITGQWTGFLEPCTDPAFLAKYKEFNLAGPRAFDGRIYTPGSNIGLSINANLLAKPETDDVSELRAYAKELSELLKEFCNLNAGEIEDAKNTIFESWNAGADLDYKSIVEKTKDAKAKKKLEDLTIAKFLFEGSSANITELWKKGEISIVAANFAKTTEIRMTALYYILRQLVDHFDSLKTTDAQDEKLRLLLVVEEVTLLDDKRVMRMLDRIARTMRKKGLGLLLVTQRLVDLGDIQTNINTKAYMRTAHKADLDRAAIELGELANTLTSLKTGSGIFFSPDYGHPVLTEFRPCMHRNGELDEDEIRRKMLR